MKVNTTYLSYIDKMIFIYELIKIRFVNTVSLKIEYLCYQKIINTNLIS